MSSIQPVYLAGPTACGKTEIAVRLARLLGGEIVGADARQIYDALPLLTAAPDAGALRAAPHHLVRCLPPEREISVFDYREMALEAAAAVSARGRRPIVAGGTGLYLQALAFGLAPAPPPSPELRARFAGMPDAELRAELCAAAPAWAAVTDLANRRRVERALERALLGQTAPPAAHWQEAAEPPARAFLLVRSRAVLRERIARRTRAMFEAGAAEEAAEFGSRPLARPPIGFAEIRLYLAGQLSLEECAARISAATRRYAKRQMTWFNARPWFRRIDLDELEKKGLDPAAAIAELCV